MVFLAFWHFIYEMIFAKNLRLILRTKLFRLRDELVNMRIENQLDEKIFDITYDSSNTVLKYMSALSISDLISVEKALENDPTYKEILDKRIGYIKNYENENFQEINKEIGEITAQVLLINHGAWLPYVLSLFLPILLIKGISSTWKWFLKLIEPLNVTRNSEAPKLFTSFRDETYISIG